MKLAGIVLIAAVVLNAGCSSQAASSSSMGVLFIGNSLTYTNDLPAMFAAIAEAEGEAQVAHRTIAKPDFSLEDHWLEGRVQREISSGQWDLIVIQQGPSALAASREHLVEWSRRYAELAEREGIRVVLLGVWPSEARGMDFDRSIESYEIAARQSKAALAPAGRAWRAAIDSGLHPYGTDGFHPSRIGSALAAVVLHRAIFGELPERVPRSLGLEAGTEERLIDAARVAIAGSN